MQRIRITTLPK